VRLAALLALAAPVLIFGCGTDAVGIEACRAIERARCEVAPVCEGSDTPLGVTEERVENCILYYRDACRLGIENVEATDIDQGQIDACVAAVQALGACRSSGAEAVGGCEGVVLTEDADPLASPCSVLKSPEKLSACAFVELPGGSDATTGGGGGEGGGGGAGGAGGAGGG
jgi:hypothetical protein